MLASSAAARVRAPLRAALVRAGARHALVARLGGRAARSSSLLAASRLRARSAKAKTASRVTRRCLSSSTSSSASAKEEGAAGLDIKGSFLEGRSSYLDMQSTTPTDPRVLDAMLPYMTHLYGNPHSRTHHYGWEAEEAVENARGQVAQLVGANPREIIFTSGATEANNTIIKGIARFYKKKKRHIITTTIEHACVLNTGRQLQQEGFDVTYLPVGTDGLVNVDEFRAAIREDTVLASVMMVNNEIGVVQPIKELGAICREHKVFMHTDSAQAIGKLPVDVNELNVDAMSMTAHKIYGSKGVGAMYLRRRPRVRIEPLIHGGGQERGLRSGTLPTFLVVGFGEACRVARKEMEADRRHVERLSKRLVDGLTSRLDEVIMNGSPTHRYAGCVNLSFSFVEGESLLMALKEIAVSSGSACTSASLEPSYVLRGIGVGEDLAHTSIRFGIGRFTTEAEIDYTIDLCVRHVERLRAMSPLYEMHKEGIDIKSIQWTA